MTAVEDAIAHLGSWGRYQLLVCTIVFLIWVPGGLHALLYVFLGAIPKHRCYLPGWDAPDPAHRNFSLPPDIARRYLPLHMDDSGHTVSSECMRFDPPLPDSRHHHDNFSAISSMVDCSVFVFDKSIFQSTTASEWNLVCEDDWKGSLVNSAYMIGFLTGAATYGELGDRFGRLPMMWVSSILGVLVGIASGVAPTFALFVVSRAAFTLTYQVGLLSYLLMMEAVSPRARIYGSFILGGFGALGEMFAPVFSYFIRDWRVLQLVCCIPLAAAIGLLPFAPESMRWLHASGRQEKFEQALQRAARKNRVVIPEHVLEAVRKESGTVTEELSASRLAIFRHANLRRSFAVLAFCWFVSSMVYYGLALYTQALGGNQFVSALLNSFSEIPAYVVSVLILDRIGRKTSLLLFFAITGISVVAIGLVPFDWHATILIFSLLGRGGIAAAFTMVYIFSTEIFPTDFRGQCLGLCSTCARVGSIISPFIALLGSYSRPLPYLAFGFFGIAAAILVIWLPETAGRQLPETIEEAEELNRHVGLSSLFNGNRTVPKNDQELRNS